MIRGLFKKPLNPLEASGGRSPAGREAAHIPQELFVACPACRATMFSEDLDAAEDVCTSCGKHLRMRARKRIEWLVDPDSFHELFSEIQSGNPLDFPGYEDKLESARRASRERESVLCGTASIGGMPLALFVMEAAFMMGSMGTVTGEKIARLFEHAQKAGLPVVGFTASGGARMQEGMLSLMQMAKTAGAIRYFSDSGGFYLAVLTDPTTGGVTASFAMLADIIVAEPGALVCFAGPRVIEQTIRQKLPPDLGRAESLLKNGFVDKIVPRSEQKKFIERMLRAHGAATT